MTVDSQTHNFHTLKLISLLPKRANLRIGTEDYDTIQITNCKYTEDIV